MAYDMSFTLRVGKLFTLARKGPPTAGGWPPTVAASLKSNNAKKLEAFILRAETEQRQLEAFTLRVENKQRQTA